MITAGNSATNVQKLAQVERAMAEMLAQTLQRGFFGTAALEVRVQDGTIQHILRRVEQVER